MTLLSVQQAADLMGLQPRMVRRYCQEGRLAAQRVGRAWLIDERAAKKFRSNPVGKPKTRKAKR